MSPPQLPLPRHRLELYPIRKPLHTTPVKPRAQILALAHIKSVKFMTTVNDGFDTYARDAYTASDG